MDGRNSSGRKISLLNDCWAGKLNTQTNITTSSSHYHPSSRPQLPLLTAGNCAQSPASASSCASTPSLTHQGSASPQTPHLSRSESSDSRAFAFATPSPVTPHFPSFDSAAALHLKPALVRATVYLPSRHPSLVFTAPRMDELPTPMYPPIPESVGVMPYPMTTTNLPYASQHSPIQQAQPLLQQQPQSPLPKQEQDDSPGSESRVSTLSNGSAGKHAPKKNQYPCPMAKQYNCTDYFTTSGHAARHAKKHTGKKDAYCPECNKAFTRKDNMEQHRRTHQNVRGPTTKTNTDNRVKKPGKSNSRKSDKPASAPLEAAVAQFTDGHIQAPPNNAAQFVMSHQQAVQQPLMAAAPGPYFVGANADPIGALPQPMPTEFLSGRPSLSGPAFGQSLDFLPQNTPVIPDPMDSHYNYPSPGLSNGLNTLAMAASDHRRMSEEDESN